jgi:hypothetical protein
LELIDGHACVEFPEMVADIGVLTQNLLGEQQEIVEIDGVLGAELVLVGDGELGEKVVLQILDIDALVLGLGDFREDGLGLDLLVGAALAHEQLFHDADLIRVGGDGEILLVAEPVDAAAQEALVLSAVLLAFTRYESVLFLLPVALLLLWGWWREGRPVLSWPVVFSPLLLVPFALHNRVFSARESAWELASRPGFERPFSFGYIPDNVAHALSFFFDTTGEQSNSLAIAGLGFIALPFLGLWLVHAFRRLPEMPPARVAFAFVSLGFAAHTLLLMCYFWGRFDDPVMRRLSLPLNLWLALAIIAVATEFRGGARRWQVLGGLALAGLFAWSLPAMARHDYSPDYYIGREIAWRREFMAAHPEKDYLFIDNSSIFWITHRVSATSMMQAVLNKESLLFNHRNHTFSVFYVYQRLDVNPETGELTVQWDDVLGPDYLLETVWERRFTPLTVSRISRVVEILDGEAQPPPPPVRAAAQPPAERERVRREYLENFIKQLP